MDIRIDPTTLCTIFVVCLACIGIVGLFGGRQRGGDK
jgi:hypothetical protein